MLKAMGSTTSEGNSSDDGDDSRMKRLQRQLDELRSQQGGKIKVLRLARVQAGEPLRGLLDSGATHALRPRLPEESLEGYRTVVITLAGDKQTTMKMSPGGVIVGDADTEPIVPMGQLVRDLGCTVQWLDTHVVISHPIRGQIPIQLCGGCPMVERSMALELIHELEGTPGIAMNQIHLKGMEGYGAWIQRLAHEHPAFDGVPEEIKQKLIADPVVGVIPGNRSLRKLWQQEGGVILHLYSGANEGFTVKRAVGDLCGERRKVVQVDLQNGDKWNMVEGELYSQLLFMAVSGQLGAVIGGPNCRTRSVLRHFPRDGFPGPARAWGKNQQWGLHASSLQRGTTQMLRGRRDDASIGDDLYRGRRDSEGWWGYINRTDKIGILIEHPAAPEDKPEVVSWWRTQQWQALQKSYNLNTYDLDQGDLGGLARKPTTLGTNMMLAFPEITVKKPPPMHSHEHMSPEERSKQTKSLARWCPVMTSGIAEACMRTVGQAVKRRLFSWKTHLAREHVPFRKDCQVCQEAMARDRPHRRQKLPPRVGVLSVDTAGPFEKSRI